MASVVPTRDELPSNSISSKHATSKTESSKDAVKQVAHGKLRNKSVARKTKNAIFASTGREVAGYVIWDVIIPATKDIIVDIVTSAADKALFGMGSAVRSRARSRAHYGSTYTNYSFTDTRASRISAGREPSRYMSNMARTNFDFDEVVFDTRAEANSVLERLNDLIETYDSATVMDFYSLSGISPTYTDNNWGWTNLATATVQRSRDGFVLILPRPESLR